MAPFGTSGKKILLATALAGGATGREAAELANVSLRTVRRKMADPEFRRLVARLRDEIVTAALGRLAESMSKAADKLTSLLDDKATAVQLRSARSILTIGLRLRESVDVAERIRELEVAVLNEKGGLR